LILDTNSGLNQRKIEKSDTEVILPGSYKKSVTEFNIKNVSILNKNQFL